MITYCSFDLNSVFHFQKVQVYRNDRRKNGRVRGTPEHGKELQAHRAPEPHAFCRTIQAGSESRTVGKIFTIHIT